MSDADFKIEGLDNLVKVLGSVANRFPEEKSKELLKLGLMLEAEVKPLVPVDTGRLRASITSQLTSPDEVETGTNVDYAQAINDGHVMHQHFVPAQYLKNCPNGKGLTVHEQFVLGKHFMEQGLQALQPKSQVELEQWIQNMLDAIEKNNEDLINTFKNI